LTRREQQPPSGRADEEAMTRPAARSARGRALPAALAALALSAALPAAAAAAAPDPHTPAPAGAPTTSDAGWAKAKWGDDTTGEGRKAAALTGTWDMKSDGGSTFMISKTIGVQDVWGKTAPSGLRITGSGVGVAVIDTGISPVPGLDGVGKVVNGVDLSTESQVAGTRFLDGFGHGTHMAALIAGRDTTVKVGDEKTDKAFVGMAPDAKLVNVKVGAGDGGVDVSQVIAGVDWVVQNKALHNIRVLNLSYGTDSSQPALSDPLAHAVENAWRAGIVVVVSAGNAGQEGATNLAMPAIDPYVLAVGSGDHMGSADPKNWLVGAWTNPGTTTRRPDLIAPGKSVVSLRVPGSYVDLKYPEGRIATETTARMFRGTGTSQSAAVVSGIAALLLQRNPTLTPDQVKSLLVRSADKLVGTTSAVQGAGVVDAKGAVELLEKSLVTSPVQAFPKSTGLGSLQLSRGSSALVDPLDNSVLSGERDLMGQRWDAPRWAAASSARAAWVGSTWNGRMWASSAWSGSSWSGRMWAGRMWASGSWNGRMWAGQDWAGRMWAGRMWASAGWSSLLPRTTDSESTW
jgi:serine protease AprX